MSEKKYRIVGDVNNYFRVEEHQPNGLWFTVYHTGKRGGEGYAAAKKLMEENL